MNKKVVVPVCVLGVLVLAVAFWAFWIPSPTAAVLYIDEGSVEVDLGNGWVAASDEMELGEGAKVRTAEGTASVVLMEGEVMHIEPNSEVSLTEISGSRIRIKQVLGETWHKVTKVSGIATYEVETPTTVATVRGTEFFVKNDEVAVDEGEVEVGFVKTPSKKLMLKTKRMMKLNEQFDEMNENVFESDPRSLKFKELYIKHLKRMRMRELLKHNKLMTIAKKTYGVSEEQVRQYLDDVDEGRQDEDVAYAKVPSMMKKKVERAYQLTKAIKTAKRMLNP